MNEYEQFSVFLILKNNILELAFSRNPALSLKEQTGSENGMDISQLLLLLCSQYQLMVTQLRESWVKWFFFVLQCALGEQFRLDSARDYPRAQFTGIQLTPCFLLNEYDLVINKATGKCTLRIEQHVKEHFLSLSSKNSKVFLKGMGAFHKPIIINQRGQVRFIDLTLVKKRVCLVTPELKQVHRWIINWTPLTIQEYGELKPSEYTIAPDELEFLLPVLPSETILSKNWNQFRDIQLEQPFGLVCEKCYTRYEANLLAKTCLECSGRLHRA